MKKIFLLAFLMLLACPLMAADTLYTANVAFTNNPANNNTVTISGVVKTFKTTVTDPSTQVQIGATTTDTYNNYAAHLVLNGYANLTVVQPASGTILTLVATLNTAITGSVSGTWGTVTVYSTPITSQALFLPLSTALSSAYRVAMANGLIIGIRDYASTNFASTTSALQHFINDSTDQLTIDGAKTFRGLTTISNPQSTFVLGAITNAELRTPFMRYYGSTTNVGIPLKDNSGVISFRLMPDTTGKLSLYLADATTPATFIPSAWHVLTGGIADNRYAQLASANELFAIQTFDALTHHDGGITIAYNAATKAVLTNASLYGVTNLFVTNFFPMGPIIGTSAVPIIRIENSTGVTGTGNYGRAWRMRINNNGSIERNVYDQDGNSQQIELFWPNSGAPTFVMQYPLGTVQANQLAVDGIATFSGKAGFIGVVGIGDTNITVPTSLTRGIVLTNGASASADPANGVALWSAGGEVFMRSSTSSEGAGANNRIFNRGEQSIGSGSDYSLTTSYAEAVFGGGVALPLPSAGTYEVGGIVTVDEDGGNANDSISAKLYNTTDAADLTGSEKTISYLPAAKRGQLNLKSIVTVTAAKTLKLYAKNATAARGTIDSDQTSLYYVRLY